MTTIILALLFAIPVLLALAALVRLTSANDRRFSREGQEKYDVIGDGGVWQPHLDPERNRVGQSALIRDIEARGL